ncbi:hypothetical protein PM082_004521 [Marasmius tenuissimus]|nr:hypothetical protein PM082_004521 [Marasmius tenuissimus]
MSTSQLFLFSDQKLCKSTKVDLASRSTCTTKTQDVAARLFPDLSLPRDLCLHLRVFNFVILTSFSYLWRIQNLHRRRRSITSCQ